MKTVKRLMQFIKIKGKYEYNSNFRINKNYR